MIEPVIVVVDYSLCRIVLTFVLVLLHLPQIVAALCVVSCAASWAPVSYHSQVLHAGHYPLAYSAPWAYAPVHYSAPVVIGHNGVPIDTPEVQAARAAHLHAHAAITGVPQDTPEVQAAKAQHFAAHAAARGHSLHKRSLYNPWLQYAHAAPVVIGHNGVPLDTPEVQAARAEHLAAHARAHSGAPALVVPSHYAHAPLGPDGRVVDTAEVAHAKAVHFNAVAKAQGYGGYHGVVPADTPEVAHAKSAHFAAVAESKSRNGAWDDGHYDGRWDGAWDGAWDGRYAYASNWYGQHVPVIANGVPVETPEVQHAKAAHAAAHAEAKARSGHW